MADSLPPSAISYQPSAIVIGASGYIGRNLCRVLSTHWRVVGTFFRHSEVFEAEGIGMDIRDLAVVEKVFERCRPDVAYALAYDRKDLQGTVVEGTGNLVEAWKRVRPEARFVYVSTDAVFDGESGPYGEGDTPRPVWEYGRAKRAAELKVLDAGGMVVRSSLVYGFNPLDPRTEELKQGLESGQFEYSYFDDEVRCPIHVEDLCRALMELGEMGQDAPRILHVAGPEPVTRYAFAVRLAKRMGYDPESVPKASLKSAGIVRPRDLTLDTSLSQSVLRVRIRPLAEVLDEPAH